MEFLQFLGYFLVSMFIYRLTILSISMIIKRYLIYKLEKDIKSGKIQFMSADELLAYKKDDDGGPTWQ